MLAQDDFQILAQSWTWERTRAGLWVPNNEHAMPLGRLLTYGVVRLAGRPTALPFAAALVGPLALLLGMVLVYQFVRRELGHPLYGLVALTLFGVSAVYQQAVYWFAASFSVLALDTLLLTLLAAQRWRKTGRALYLDLAVAWAALAPAWFASGILAGPLCCLYLVPGRRDEDRGSRIEDRGSGPEGWSVNPRSSILDPRSSFTFLPLLGSVLFLAVSLPRTASAILRLEHYQGKTAVEVFRPLVGLGYTCRSVVDNLLLGFVGVCTVEVPVPAVAVVLPLLVTAGAWWWWQTPRRRLVLLGMGLVGSSYLLTYSARATWGYDGVMTQPGWTRYHLLPQLGLALLMAGGLPGRVGRWFRLEAGRLTQRQVGALALLIGLCFAVQLPRGLLCCIRQMPGQADSLRRIEEMDARCRALYIRADTARKALPPLTIQDSWTGVNGWEFLRGSDQPREVPPEEARRLLEGRE
jgi:hypothetical protein